MIPAAWHLFGIDDVKLYFIPILRKMYVIIKLEKFVMNYMFCTMCLICASPTRCVKQIQSPFLIAEKQH